MNMSVDSFFIKLRKVVYNGHCLANARSVSSVVIVHATLDKRVTA